MHLSDSRLASGRGGFRFSGLEMVGMKEEKKVERGVMVWQTRGDFTQFLQVSLGGRRRARAVHSVSGVSREECRHSPAADFGPRAAQWKITPVFVHQRQITGTSISQRSGNTVPSQTAYSETLPIQVKLRNSSIPNDRLPLGEQADAVGPKAASRRARGVRRTACRPPAASSRSRR